MSASRIHIATGDIEVDKPQGGGGRGTDRLYWIDVMIDGKLAIHLTRINFQETGQMALFVELMKELTR